MKAQLNSDCHTELYYGEPFEALRGISFVPNLDFLLLPGDIVVPAYQPKAEMKTIFDFLASKARHLVLTMGNHEHYGSKKYVDVKDALLEVLPDNAHLLDNSEITLDGIHFYGGVMWFPDDPLNQLYERQLNDFNLIGGIRKWVYQKNTEFRENGRKMIRPETVVLSHHLPSSVCITEQYRGNELNRFFVSDESDLILEKKPRLWVYGHTHNKGSFIMGNTQLETNPFGYPHERDRWAYFPPVVFEV